MKYRQDENQNKAINDNQSLTKSDFLTNQNIVTNNELDFLVTSISEKMNNLYSKNKMKNYLIKEINYYLIKLK